MKNLIPKIVFALLLIFGSLQILYAQEEPKLATQMSEKMKTALNLSEEQTKQMEAIHLKYAQIIKEKRKTLESKSNLKEEIKALRNEKNREIRTVLSEEQYQTLQKIKEEKKLAFKQDTRKKYLGSRRNPALMKELKQYRKDNILPVMKTQRAKLENYMSAEDKEKIAFVKTKIEELKPKIKAIRKNLKETIQLGATPTEIQKEALQKLISENKSYIKTLKELAEKYDSPINLLFEEISDKRSLWEKDIKAIVEKYQKEEDNISDKFSRNKGFKKTFQKLHFLLLETEKENARDEKASINLYPNPAVAYQKIELKVKKAGNVTIDLLNEKGIFVKNILNEHKEAGTYSIEVDTQNLDKSLYLYKINIGKKVITKRLLVK